MCELVQLHVHVLVHVVLTEYPVLVHIGVRVHMHKPDEYVRTVVAHDLPEAGRLREYVPWLRMTFQKPSSLGSPSPRVWMLNVASSSRSS